MNKVRDQATDIIPPIIKIRDNASFNCSMCFNSKLRH